MRCVSLSVYVLSLLQGSALYVVVQGGACVISIALVIFPVHMLLGSLSSSRNSSTGTVLAAAEVQG